MLQEREPRSGKLLLLAGIILPNEKLADAAVSELFEEAGLPMTVDDLTLFNGGAHVRLSLHGDKLSQMYVYSAFVHVPYANANLRTLAKVEEVVISQSIIHHDGYYVVQTTVDIDGYTMTPTITDLLKGVST
jgi:8-oxo-dGTP pyrophosphatase MutT (NUDIX family)